MKSYSLQITFYILILTSLLFSSCAKLQEIGQSTSHTTDETLTGIDNTYEEYKASALESGVVQLFTDCATTVENREKYYINWNSRSSYNANRIYSNYLKDKNIKASHLSQEQQMQILKEYFLEQLKQKHIQAFSQKYKKPKFDKYKSDSENIDMINEYKLQLVESKHQWKINLQQTRKIIAKKMYSTFYGKPKIQFDSYDTFWKDAYYTVRSSKNNFIQKIKIDIDPEIAREIEKNLSRLKLSVFFNIDDNDLKFIGINLHYKNKDYCADNVETTYVRENNIVFTDEEINLKSIEVSYTQTMRNITMPSWYRTLSQKDHIIGYGEGKTKDEAKAQARADIRETIDVTVKTKFQSTKKMTASTYLKSSSVDIQTESKAKTLKGSSVIKEEKKDGLWFVAIKYKIT